MITQVFATKREMTQAWTTTGKRLAVTRVHVSPNAVVGQKETVDSQNQPLKKLEIGFGTKKLKNMTKPLRSKLEKGGFSFGVQSLREVAVAADETLKPGDKVTVDQVLQVGDVVAVQGTTKGRGFAGAVKRHGFSGGPKTHGQSDRQRAVGAIGQRTTPGRVFRGKRMPGHYGIDTQTVSGLVVLHLDPATQEVWLSGPVPGHINSVVTITKMGVTKNIEIDQKASGIKVVAVEAPAVEATVEAPAAESAPAETTEQAGGAQ